MATQATPVAATTVAATVAPSNSARRFLYIKSYVYVPNGGGSPSQQSGILYVAFGQAATPGQNGEYELVPGAEYSFGGPLPPSVGNLPRGFILPVCPQESISVVSTSGTVYGTIVQQ